MPHSAVEKSILQPFFFASIGFAIPITRMFSSSTIWRGVVYAIMMFMGKLICGLWLVRFVGAIAWVKSKAKSCALAIGRPFKVSTYNPNLTANRAAKVEREGDERETSTLVPTTTTPAQPEPSGNIRQGTVPHPSKPLSLYPASIVWSSHGSSR